MLNTLKTYILLFILSTSFYANADLIQWDAFEAGDGLAVKNQATGVVWLDLTQTAGVSYNLAGDLYEGWEYANSDQVQSLFTTAFNGFAENGTEGEQLGCISGQVCYSEAQSFGSLFGYTPHAAAPTFHYSFGLYANQDGNLKMSGTIVQNPLSNANIYSHTYARDYNNYFDNSFYNLAVYLVQSADEGDNNLSMVNVAEPAPLAIMFLGGFMVFFRQKLFTKK